MLRASSPRFGSSKGVSTAIGTVFLVLVVFVICTNVFLWTIVQNTRYNQAVKESRQMDADRFSERVAISQGAYSVTSDKVRFDATLTNEGPVPVQILTLWVVDATIENYDFESGLNINLNPGDSRLVSGEVTMPRAESDHWFNVWYVTARGNLVSYVPPVSVSNMTSVMGPVLLNYQSLRWISADDSGTWNITKGTKVTKWFLSLTNYFDENIMLSNSSTFKMAHSSGPESYFWNLKNEYVLPVGREVTITFQDLNPPSISRVGTYPTSITLVGKYASGQPYGQMFSFVAIEVVESD